MICISSNVNGSKSTSCIGWTFRSKRFTRKKTIQNQRWPLNLGDPNWLTGMILRWSCHSMAGLSTGDSGIKNGTFCTGNSASTDGKKQGHIWDCTGRKIRVRKNILRKLVTYRGDLVIVEQIGDSTSWYSGNYIFQFEIPQKRSLEGKVSWLLLWQNCLTISTLREQTLLNILNEQFFHKCLKSMFLIRS